MKIHKALDIYLLSLIESSFINIILDIEQNRLELVITYISDKLAYRFDPVSYFTVNYILILDLYKPPIEYPLTAWINADSIFASRLEEMKKKIK